jgi:uncharacterized membrane protein
MTTGDGRRPTESPRMATTYNMTPVANPIPTSAGIYPLHIILASYPTACFTGAFLTDIAYANTYEMQWANFSVWLITAGLLMGALAAVVGIVDYLINRHRRERGAGRLHTMVSLLVLLLSLWNVFVHSRDAYTSVVPIGIILSGIVTVLVLVSSWLGTAAAWRQHLGTTR